MISTETTLPSIYDETFFEKIIDNFHSLIIITWKLHHRCLTEFLMHPQVVDTICFPTSILNGKLLSCASLKSNWPRSSQKVTNFYEGYTYRSYSFNCWMNTGYSYSKLSFSYPCWCWTRMWKFLKLWPLTNLIAC